MQSSQQQDPVKTLKDFIGSGTNEEVSADDPILITLSYAKATLPKPSVGEPTYERIPYQLKDGETEEDRKLAIAVFKTKLYEAITEWSKKYKLDDRETNQLYGYVR